MPTEQVSPKELKYNFTNVLKAVSESEQESKSLPIVSGDTENCFKLRGHLVQAN